MNRSNKAKKEINVRLVYRSYKPIHSIYQSLISYPPEGVKYIVPKVSSRLKPLHRMYKKYRQNRFVKFMVGIVDKYIFARQSGETEDLLHFISVVHPNPDALKSNYVIEIEHAMALTKMDHNVEEANKALTFLQHSKCRGIICLSEAAKGSLQKMLGDEAFKTIQDKIHIVYPASVAYDASEMSEEIIKKEDRVLDVLFVGNDCYRKGLQELLVAMEELPASVSKQLRLHVVSNDARDLVYKHKNNNVKLYPANLSRDDVIRKLFLPSDVFVFPTKHDTFGMVLIDAIAAGIPVVTTRQFAIPELIKNGKNGILLEPSYSILDDKVAPSNDDRKMNEDPSSIDAKLVSGVKKVLINITKDRAMLNDMRGHADDYVGTGKIFSIDRRNKKLRTIYEESIS